MYLNLSHSESNPLQILVGGDVGCVENDCSGTVQEWGCWKPPGFFCTKPQRIVMLQEQELYFWNEESRGEVRKIKVWAKMMSRTLSSVFLNGLLKRYTEL